MAGPQTREKLGRRSVPALQNVVERQRKQLEQIQHDYLRPGTGFRQLGRPGEGLEGVGPDSWWNVKANQPRNNSGLMLALANSPAVNKMKNIYSQFDPFFPNVDLYDQRVGYDFNKNLWGGTLRFGGGYGTENDDYNAYLNWGTNW